MTKFKAGDKFIPRKPKDSMALYAVIDEHWGKVFTVNSIENEWIRSVEYGYRFHKDWCEKVEEESVNFVQREGDVIAIEATLSTNATLAECSKPFIIATSNQYEGIKSEEGTAKAPYEPYIPLSTKHIPEVRKMVESSETPNGQERVPDVTKMVDWEQRRYELAKDFGCAAIIGYINSNTDWQPDVEAKKAVKQANEMIKQLKEQ